jgi:hypothetical protein
MKMKAILLSSFLVAGLSSQAQVRTDMSVIRERTNSSVMDNATEYSSSSFYSLGVSYGATKMYGDLAFSNPQPAYAIELSKNLVGRLQMGWQFQVGDFSTRDAHSGLRSFNHYIAVDQHFNLELGTFIGIFYPDYNDNIFLRILGGFYAGAGVGIINNDIKRIADVQFTNQYNGEHANNNPALIQSSTALYIPINAGFNYHVRPFWKFKGASVFGNFQFGYTMSDYIDGYKPPYKANTSNDAFTVASIGFRFNLFNAAASMPAEE